MALLTVGGLPLVSEATLPTYSIVESSGTLGSGQQFTAKTPTGGPGFCGVIFLHSAGGTEADMIAAGPIKNITDRLCALGFPCIAGRYSGESWGNNQSRTDITELWTRLKVNQSADTATVAFLGLSMGGWAAMSWASQNLASVSSIATIVGVMDGQAFYDDVANGNAQTSINTAYGGAPGWVAAQPTHDPKPLAASGAFTGLKARLWYGTTDVNVPAATQTAFAASVGATVTTQAVPGNHLTATLAMPVAAIAGFIIQNYPPAAGARGLLGT